MHSRFLDLSNMAVVSQQRYNHGRTTSTGVSKCNSRRGVPIAGELQQLETLPEIFQQIYLLWGPLEIDLFASWLTNQLPRCVSWKPDPGAEVTDAFSLNWAQHRGYAFPPFVLIGRCLKQVIHQQVPSLVIVTSGWEMRSWFPLLLELCVDQPLLLPASPNLLTREQEQHPLQGLSQPTV